MHRATRKNAVVPVNVNDLDIESSLLHLDEVEGALNWVNGLLALFGVTFGVGTTVRQSYLRSQTGML
jgi:hypothetical protein